VIFRGKQVKWLTIRYAKCLGSEQDLVCPTKSFSSKPADGSNATVVPGWKLAQNKPRKCDGHPGPLASAFASLSLLARGAATGVVGDEQAMGPDADNWDTRPGIAERAIQLLATMPVARPDSSCDGTLATRQHRFRSRQYDSSEVLDYPLCLHRLHH
jgi:hypothetical protein